MTEPSIPGFHIPADDKVNSNNSETVFVTGSSGLVGSALIKQLLINGKKVKALYRKEIPKIPGHEQVDWIKGDILDVIVLNEAMQNVSYVYHCAAIISFNPKKKFQLFKTNIEGTANVVNAALTAELKKLCYVSSVAALGRMGNGQVINENIIWNEKSNISNYGKSKHLGEIEVWRGIGEGLQAVIVNPSIILGGANWNEGSTKIFKKAFKEFPWYTNGITGFVDVEDVVNAMILLTDSNINGERFIVSAANLSFKEVFTMIAIAFQKKAPYKKAGPILANLVLLAEAVKSLFSDDEPLLTRETATAAQTLTLFDNNKLKEYLPSFSYTPVQKTIERVCSELKEKYRL